MTDDEPLDLLAAFLPEAPQDLELLRVLAARLHQWPLLLKLAGARLRARLERGDDLKGAIGFIERAYDKQGLIAFDPQKVQSRHDAVAATLEATLEEFDKPSRRCLTKLAIFPEDVDILIGVLPVLWQLDETDCENRVTDFDQYSLLERLDLGLGTFRLHDEVRAYLRRQIDGADALSNGETVVLEMAKKDPYIAGRYVERGIAVSVESRERIVAELNEELWSSAEPIKRRYLEEHPDMSWSSQKMMEDAVDDYFGRHVSDLAELLVKIGSARASR